MEIIERVREAMRADGRPLRVFAEKLGMNEVSIRKFSARKRDMSLEKLTELADELGLEIKVVERKRRV